MTVTMQKSDVEPSINVETSSIDLGDQLNSQDCDELDELLSVDIYIPYSGKVWRKESLANLANSKAFNAKHKPFKFFTRQSIS